MEYYGLTFIGNSIFFGFFVLMCIRRFFVLLMNGKKKVKVWILFYISIFFSLLVRAGSLVYTGLTLDSDEQKNDVTDLYNFSELFNAIPYMAYLISYFLIIWHYLIYYIRAHINLANDRNLFTEDVPNLTKKTIIMMFIVFPLFFVVFIVLSVLAIIRIINESILIKTVSYFNIFSPCILLGNYIFLNVKFSGRPYRDEFFKKNVKRIIKISIIWSLTRIISGIIYLIFNITDLKSFIIDEEAAKSDNQYKTINIILIFVFFILLEILPIYFSLEHNFAKTFIREEQVNNNENKEKLIQSISTENNNSRTSVDIRVSVPENVQNVENDNEIKIEVNIEKNIKDYLINENEIEMGEKLFEKKKGLGELYRGIYKNENVICRIIKFDRLSRYNIENIISDFKKIINLSHPNIDLFLGYYIGQDNKVIIVNKEYKNGSLYDYVQVNQKILSNEEKMNIAIGIINGINYLHKHKIIHCHLSSKNILLDDDLNPKLADFGFTNLYEFANLFNKYKNKNSYSPPEVLKSSEFYKMPEKIDENLKKIDIYSFGMILWELVTGTVPFDVKLSEIKKYVLKEKVRPEVPQNIDENLIALIRNCWDSEIDKRPTEEEIIKFFNENKNMFANG